MISRSLLTSLILFSLLPACTSPPGPHGGAGAGSPAGPALAISGPIVDAATNKPLVAGVCVGGKSCVTMVNNPIT